jgi:hypothetical protein
MLAEVNSLLKIYGTTSKNSQISHCVRIRTHCIRGVNEKITPLPLGQRGWITAIVPDLADDMIGREKRPKCIAWVRQVSIVALDLRDVVHEDLLELLSAPLLLLDSLLPSGVLV